MLTITRHEIIKGLRDAKFLFMVLIVLAAFLANGLVYAERYQLAQEDWRENIATTSNQLEARTGSLREISSYAQRMSKPPSALAFIADGGEERLPNTILVNAFVYMDPSVDSRGNEMFVPLPNIDWVFIVGSLISLMALLLSFGSICGEKRDGTLRQVLSNQVSRFSIFFGKYLGLLLVLVVTLLVGAAVSILVLAFSGALPISELILTSIGWSLLISILAVSFVLLLGIAVSSMVHRPAVSLVVLMIFWLVGIVAIPGLARLYGSDLVDVPTPYEVRRDLDQSYEDIWYNAPEGSGDWHSNLEYAFSKAARNRAETVQRIISDYMRIRNEANDARIHQAETVRMLACISPAGMLDDSLQKLCGTGVSGYKSFYDTARRYQQQLHRFTVERDNLDGSSPHTVYAWWFGTTRLTYSDLPVEFGSFPRSHVLWEAGGLNAEREFPLFSIILFIVGNLQLAIIGFIAFACYDPR